MFGLEIRYKLYDDGHGHNMRFNAIEPMLWDEVVEFIDEKRKKSYIEIINIDIRAI